MPRIARLRRALATRLLATVAAGAPPAQPDPLEPFVGTYRRQPVENAWHVGRITRDGDRGLRWTNDAGVSWTLRLDPASGALMTGPGNPYAAAGRGTFQPERGEDGTAAAVRGFWFGDELFVRDGAMLIAQRSGGLMGYISAHLARIPERHGHGISFYVSVWSLLDRPLAGFQIGLPSTWIIPDNRGFREPLCPPGTVARDQWPERGPTWDSVFQTIEGGLGFWVNTRFPSAVPKYRINGTPDGYNHEISSPGWGFGRTEALAAELTGIAQISNRLLVPPDGLTFCAEASGDAVEGLLGNAWMALPLTPARVDRGTPTGDLSWTLFLHAANFRGPVAFWLADTWSRLSQGYPTIHGRGLDARPGRMNGGAMEVNTVPYFVATAADGTTWSRIPRLRFPIDGAGRTLLFQDVALYSRATLFDRVAAWLRDRGPLDGHFGAAGSARPELEARPLSLRQRAADGGRDLPLAGFDQLVATAVHDVGGGRAFGLAWRDVPGRGQLPEYWRRQGDALVPAAAEEVPAETGLTEQVFARPRRFASYEPPPDGASTWRVEDPRLGPFTVDLADGSRVTYAWFAFLDQPVLRDRAKTWSEATRRDLRALVDEIHRAWRIDGSYLPAPSAGKLVGLDAALLVQPPPGFETGYVPVALAQRRGD